MIVTEPDSSAAPPSAVGQRMLRLAAPPSAVGQRMVGRARLAELHAG